MPIHKKGKIESVFTQQQYNLNIRKRSFQWYTDQIRKLKSVTSNSLLRSETDLLTNRLEVGKMYLYLYDPKYKETLPYYDMFPLTLPFNRDADHVISLNLHYIHPMIRVRMLDQLMDYATNDKLDKNTKLNFSWQLIKGSSTMAPLKPCIHMYRFDHIRSNFIEIPPANWVTACMLPVEDFKKRNKMAVYASSMKGL